MTGEFIHEYEYQEDGQTRLFKEPVRVTQNNNTDVCTINWTSGSTGELVILSSSGSLHVIYRGHEHKKDFKPTEMVSLTLKYLTAQCIF